MMFTEPSILRDCVNKRKYRNKALAEEAKEHREAVSGTPLAIYQCFFCRHWHITKMVPPTEKGRE